MEAAVRSHLSVEAYFALEENALEKHEYFQGEIFAMSGVSFNHSTVQATLTMLMGNQLRGRGCRVLTSDFRVHVEAVGLYTYPDLSVVCGEPRLEGTRALLNPTVLFEVLSPSTEAYDRGAKFALYRQLESLQQYVLIAQDRFSVELFTRQADGSWRFEAFSGPDTVARLESIGCALSLADLYERVTLSAHPVHPSDERQPPDDRQS